MEINIQKTKEMRIGGRNHWSLMVKLLIRVSDFTYLGSVISETGGTNEGITARIRKTQTVFSMLMPVWKLFLSD